MPAMLSGLLAGLGAFASRLLLSLATEKFIAYLFFLIADRYVQSTNTDFDNKLVEQMKKAYEKTA